MADRVISAEVRIDGRDNGVSALFDRISAKLDRMSKTKVSPQFSNLATDLSKAEQQLRAIEKVSATKVTSDIARRKAEQAHSSVREAKAAMQGMEAPTRQMQATLDKANAAFAKTLDSLHRQKAALAEAKSAATGLGVALNKLPEEHGRLVSSIDKTTLAMERQVAVERKATAAAAARHKVDEQRRERADRMGFKHYAMQTGAGYLAAHSLVEGGREAIRAGAELQGSKAQARLAGMPSREVTSLSDQALALSGRYRNVSQAQLIEMGKEARSALTHPEEVREVLPALAAARSVLSITDRTGAAGENLNALLKGAENLGAAQSPERLVKLIDGWTKAMQVMGSTISPEQVFDFARASRLSGAQLSDRFLMTTAMSMSQDLTGASAGKAVNQMRKQLVGGLAHQTVPTMELMNLGLIDRKDVRFNKVGEVSGVKPGVLHAVKGDNLVATDPDLWVYRHLLPAMIAKGITKEGDQLAEVSKIFPGVQAADLVGKLIKQRPSLEGHTTMYPKASGLHGAEEMNDNALMGWASFTTQLHNLAAIATEPAMAGAGQTLNAIAGGLASLSSSLSTFNKDHPDLAPYATAGAATAGAVGAGLAGRGVVRGSLGMLGRALGIGGAEAAAAEGAAAAGTGAILPAGMALPALAGLAAAGGTIYGLNKLAPNEPQRGRAEPASQRDGTGPGYFATGRGGAPIWISNAAAPMGRNMGAESVAPLSRGDLMRAYDTPAAPLDIRPAVQRNSPLDFKWPSGSPQTIDVTGKVESDVNAKVVVEVTAPEGLQARVVNQTVIARPGMGPTMKHAALGQGGVGHM